MSISPPVSPQLCNIIASEMFGGESTEPARQRLLMAGLKLFADQGFEKTSIRQIAVEAGTNVAAISYYFGGKVGLYQTVFWGGHVPPAEDQVAAAPAQLASLDEIIEHLLAPLRSGKAARAWMKLQRREMLEPTGLWQQKVDLGLVPMHASLVSYLCRRLGLRKPDDEVQALALLVIGPAVHVLVNCEIVDLLAPELLDGDAAVDAWRERLLRSAEAVIEAERLRRFAVPARAHLAARATGATHAARGTSVAAKSPSPRSSRNKA